MISPSAMASGKAFTSGFGRWAEKGVWERVFTDLIDDPDNASIMPDTTLIRAHQQAARGKGRRATRLCGFQRRINHQGPHTRRRARASTQGDNHARPAGRNHHNP